MIKDINIVRAVSSISQRAERQRDIDKLVSSYVEVGILPQLINNNNQILFGRRGTGKTHILKFYESQVSQSKNVTLVYIDCRVLGSSPQFSDTRLSLTHRCSSLFIDVLEEIFDSLLNHIVYNPNSKSEEAVESLSELSKKSFSEIQRSKKVHHNSMEEDSSSGGIGVNLGLTNPGFALDSKGGNKKSDQVSEEFNLEDFEKIVFPDLNTYLKKVLDYADTELIIVIDEWSAIPYDIQPYLAEFIKKSFIPTPYVTIKIGALEYRSNFTIPRDKHNYVGLELGSDISSNLDIDEYYVYDRNPDEITDTFADILHKHIKSELPDNYLTNELHVSTVNQFIQGLFSGKPAFSELVRASEGVIRDFINIFNIAFFDAQRKGLKNIDKKTIIEASRQWFENDKSKNLDDDLHIKIRLIIDEVIGKKRARSFLVPRELERHPVIQQLFDARVIHLVKKGYSDKDTPGVRYNIYTLDYGTYVDLINTSKQPVLEFEEPQNKDDVVPFDDKRSIRRIILTRDILN